jgi:hypothetical protein
VIRLLRFALAMVLLAVAGCMYVVSLIARWFERPASKDEEQARD